MVLENFLYQNHFQLYKISHLIYQTNFASAVEFLGEGLAQ